MATAKGVHLLVLVHGMWGNPDHLAEMKRIVLERKGAGAKRDAEEDSEPEVELDLLVAHSNRDESTYDGIDWGGERVADEIIKRAEELEKGGKKVLRFSVIGYSLGGLLARYVIGILRTRSFFKDVKPVNFMTVATPHIGLINTDSIWSSIGALLGPKLLSRTGEQFFGVDKWGSKEKSLLEVMADPKEIFYQALLDFKYVRIYGNAVNDRTVPYATSLIDFRDPFLDRKESGLEVEFDPEYDPMILSYSIPEEPPAPEKGPAPFTAAWFRSFKTNYDLPPPFRRVKFPLSTLVWIALPVLVPTFLTLVIIRLSLHSRDSRKRIRLLENDESSQENALVHIFSKFENEIERAVVDVIEDDMGQHSEAETRHSQFAHEKASTTNGNAHHSPSATKVANAPVPETTITDKPTKGQPLLTTAQKGMVNNLNAIPQMTKHMAFIDPILNAHATIIARDVKNFDLHKRGWGVLKHMADSIEL